MTSASYMEQYLDLLQHLPVELQRNFKLMRDLDERALGVMRTIDLESDDMLASLSSLDNDVKNQKIATVQNLFNKAKEYGDDKVQLAIQTYELVDKHIRRLDADLARFEAEVQEKATSQQGSDASPAGPAKKGRKKKTEKAAAEAPSKKKKVTSEEETATPARGASVKRRSKKAARAVVGEGEEAEDDSSTHPSDVLDMPVDPNEPTYCLCHQVSYGEMIGCDNPDCTIEWFHFACVDLQVKPKGKWYCPKCSQDRKRK